MKAMKMWLLASGIGLAMVGGACSTAPKTEADKEALTANTAGALANFKAADPTLQGLLDRSVGYAVFPSIGKAGFVVGGAFGRGEVFEGGKKIGYADVTKANIGATIGAQTFSELLIFLTPEKLNAFKQGNFSLTADVSAVAIKSGAAAASNVSKGVVVFVKSDGGFMAEASVGGQGFSFVPTAK